MKARVVEVEVAVMPNGEWATFQAPSESAKDWVESNGGRFVKGTLKFEDPFGGE